MATKKVPARTKRAAQPQGAIRVNWSNPLTRGLIVAYNSGVFVNLISGTIPQKNLVTSGIQSFEVASTNARFFEPNVGTPSYTMMIIVRSNGTNPDNNSAIAGVAYDQLDTSPYGDQIDQGPTATRVLRFSFNNGTLNTITDSTGGISTTKYETIFATYTSGSQKLYRNGNLVASSSFVGNPVYTATSVFCVGAYPATARNSNVSLKLVTRFNRALSPSEIRELTANPWQLFQQSPAKSSLWLNQLGYRLATRLTNTGDYFVNGYLDEVSKNISSVDSSSILYASEFDEVTFKKYYFELPLLANKITQPQYATKIDWSNPITKGLVICTHAGTNFTELVSGNFSTITSAKQTATKNGKAFSNISSTFSIDTKVTTSFPDPVTWVCGITPNTTGGGNGLGRIFDKRSTGNATQVELLYFNASLAPEFNRGPSSNQQTVRATNVLTAGVYTVVAVTSATFTGTNNAIYYNGVNQSLVGGANSGGTGAIPTNAASYVLGNRTDDNARNFDGKISFAYRWNRVLSPAEIASISTNPYQIFKSSNQSVYISRNKNLARRIANTGNTYITGSFDEYTKIS